MSEKSSDVPKPSVPKPNISPASSAPPVRQNLDADAVPKAKAETVPEDEIETSRVPLNSRIIAFLIDAGVALALSFAFSMLPSVLGYLGALVPLAYITTRDSLPFLKGQSIGKSVMKYRAVTASGKGLSGDWKTGAIRNVPLCIPLFPVVELAILLTREDKEGAGVRLGDEWAGTRVEPFNTAAMDSSEEDGDSV